jgi:hypothetical protein
LDTHPGRHPKRPHWSKAWDAEAERWLDDEGTIRRILATMGVPASAIPAEVVALAEDRREKGRRTREEAERRRAERAAAGPDTPRAGMGDHELDLFLAREAIGFVPGAEDYDTWIAVGAALKNALDEEGRDLWDDWSSTCQAKFSAEANAAKWAKLGGEGRVGLGLIFSLAERGGWCGAKERIRQIRAAEQDAAFAAWQAGPKPDLPDGWTEWGEERLIPKRLEC